METQPYGDPLNARILVIGHDPRLQNTDTIAPYCFFADYYFKPQPTLRRERAKYDLASALFSCVMFLTSERFSAEQVMVTNLCNRSLPHAPPNKTVLIPEKDAREGLIAIRKILAASNIEIIFAKSLQVNYWLQTLSFYSSTNKFVAESRPKQAGLQHAPPYYESIKPRTFQMICGNRYIADNKYALFPILHIKQWPLKDKFALAYDKAYENCRNTLKST
jgi:hypothetical protein